MLNLPEWALDNLLVGQKNKILFLVNGGRLSEAQAALDVVFPFWSSCQYLYKYYEIKKRIEENLTTARE